MVFCPKCGAEVPDGAVFCPKCGAAIVSHPSVKKGEVWDLAKKLERGEITRKEVVEEMERRGLSAHAGEPFPGVFSVTGLVVWAILSFLPAFSEISKIEALAFFNQLPRIVFPTPIVYTAIILSVAALYLFPYGDVLRQKRGGGTEEHTVILVKEGPYRIVRHPELCGVAILLIAFPVIMSSVFAFTVLSFLGDLALALGAFLQSMKEEEFNLRKWGDEYRKYMREVPRLNFILGVWRWIKG